MCMTELTPFRLPSRSRARLLSRLALVLLATMPASLLAADNTAPAAQAAAATGQARAAEAAAEAAMAESGSGRTLEDFFVSAMEYSPRIQVAEARRDIGTARKRQATGQLLPQVSASANVSENRQETSDLVSRYRGERYALQLRQVLFDWQGNSTKPSTLPNCQRC